MAFLFFFTVVTLAINFQLIHFCNSWIISRPKNICNNFAKFNNFFQHWNTKEKLTLSCSSGDSSTSQDGYWDPYSAPKLDFDECYYKVLEVESTVGVKELKKSYYKVVFKYHPDNKETAEEKELCNKQMMVINGAYRVLKDPTTRLQYDKQRAQGLFGASAGVKGSGKNDRSAASKGSPKPPSRAAESTQSQTQQQQQRQASSNVNFNSGSPSAAKFWSSFFQQQQQQQSAEDFASWSQDSYEYDDVEADAEEYFQDTVDYRIYGRPNSRSNGDSRYAAADGSVTGLMARYRSLKAEKKRLEDAVLADNRDWGEVTDMAAVTKRLKDIQEIKNLAIKIADLEDEIENLTYDRDKRDSNSGRYSGGGYEYDPYGRPSSSSSSSSSSAWGSSSSSSDRSRWDPRERFREPSPQPQPQPQPQRQSDNQPPRRQYTETDDYYDDLMRKWRQQQLEQGANKDLRTQRKTQSDRESRDLWAEFDSYGNLATPKSNKEESNRTWREDMNQRRNPNTKARILDDDDDGGDSDDESDIGSEGLNSGDEAVLNELEALYEMWKKEQQ